MAGLCFCHCGQGATLVGQFPNVSSHSTSVGKNLNLLGKSEESARWHPTPQNVVFARCLYLIFSLNVVLTLVAFHKRPEGSPHG